MPSLNLSLSTEIQYLSGVGPSRARLFAERGIQTVEDLLYYTPFRYEDRTKVTHIRDLLPGQTATVLARVLTCGLTRTRSGVYIYDLAAADASQVLDGSAPVRSATLRCKWFNAVYLQKNKVFRPGQLVFFYGKAQHDRFGTGNLQMVQPQHEILPETNDEYSVVMAGTRPQTAGSLNQEAATRVSLEIGRIVPIYEAIGLMSSRVLRRLIWAALESLKDNIPECLPESVIQQNKLIGRPAAIKHSHFPEPDQRLEDLLRFRTPAQVRLIFEELFNVSAGLALKRQKHRAATGVQFKVTDSVRQAIKKVLPFHPTAAQKRVLKEIAQDMCSPHPMNRLLQGDVGSGKTIVALQAAIVAMESGYQVALMAPTEILATQHFLYTKRLFENSAYKIELLISARKAGEKADLKNRMAAGAVDLVVGTHALIEGDVSFAKLGLVIVDEQHRFGVLQRYSLMRKGPTPDVLVMTATPIPRTLALTLYGDLDFSVIDELPPNRTPIETRLLAEKDRARAFEFIRAKLKAGEQAYVIYPIIEESEKLDLRPAVRMYEHLSRNVFPEYTIGLLHGRMSGEEKDSTMEQFKNGRINLLVATTVVEVGVDVPNATVMLIEHAERFGLAPLHQLRGRIGRGGKKSTCLLLADDPRTEVADERLRTLVETTDGFRIAEADLKIRGPGEFFGTRQTGIPAFRIANLIRDQKIMEWAKREASEFVGHPPSPKEYEAYASGLRKTWRRYKLAKVG